MVLELILSHLAGVHKRAMPYSAGVDLAGAHKLALVIPRAVRPISQWGPSVVRGEASRSSRRLVLWYVLVSKISSDED